MTPSQKEKHTDQKNEKRKTETQDWQFYGYMNTSQPCFSSSNRSPLPNSYTFNSPPSHPFPFPFLEPRTWLEASIPFTFLRSAEFLCAVRRGTRVVGRLLYCEAAINLSSYSQRYPVLENLTQGTGGSGSDARQDRTDLKKPTRSGSEGAGNIGTRNGIEGVYVYLLP